MGQLESESYADRPLAVMLTSVFMPETEVSPRTDTTYRTGAEIMLKHLMAGDWNSNHASPAYNEFMGEFMSRVLKNARRQGVVLSEEDPELGPHYRHSGTYEPYLKENPTHDWVMVGDETSTIYDGGTDAQLPGEEAYEEFQHHIGEKVHLFGRPVQLG
ncbi:MAG: hypothetical protein ACR2FM_02375 [Candidatus Saccharimonadales bacterium]